MKTKQFRLFKRDGNGQELAPTEPDYKARHYYFKFTYRGKRHVRSLF